MTLALDRLRRLRKAWGSDSTMAAAFDELIARREAEASDKRQRAIALLQSWLDGDCDADEARSLADTLEALRPRDRWKPASEPPNTDRPVLVYGQGAMVVAFYKRFPRSKRGQWEPAEIDGREWYLDLVPEKWRELPEAP